MDDAVRGSEIATGAVGSSEIGGGAVRAAEIGDGVHIHGGDTITFNGGTVQNGDWASETETASCEPGEELISGYGKWTDNDPGDELAISEIDLDMVAETVTVTAISDWYNPTFRAVAVCLRV